MIFDKNKYFATAEVKNRAARIKLEEELANLERQKQRELKLSNIQRQKFKSKYAKSTKEVSEVTMYQTHYPGFCYTRTGEQRHQPSMPEKTAPVQFEHIRSLIFTSGEVDLDKILCLHLLSTHRTETLTPPKRKVRLVCRDHSPTERLVDKSKRGFTHFERLSKLLPLFTVELTEQNDVEETRCPLINDGRLASRILINEKVMALINTVVTTLENSNVDKFRQLVLMGNNPTLMKSMLNTVHIAEFLDSLSDHKLINSCDSFVLTPPFRIKVQTLEVKTSHGSLEALISHFRENVLQPPVRKTHDLKHISKHIGLFRIPTSNNPQSSMNPSRSSKSSAKQEFATPESSKIAKFDVRKTDTWSLDHQRHISSHQRINFVARNKEMAGKTKKIEYDVDEDEWDMVPMKQSSILGKTKSVEPVVILKAPSLSTVTETDSAIEKMIEVVDNSCREESYGEVHEHKAKAMKKKRQVKETPLRKYSIRHTNCPACMERWKMPLPTPKTPTLKESDVLPELYGNSLKTNHQRKIARMINKAMYDLQSYDRRYSQENDRFKKIPLTKKDIEETLDNVYLNPMDLAKIEQEIKERETQKKLEKFLKRYSKDKNEFD